MERFLTQPWNARIVTLGADGWPYAAAVWYEYEAAGHTFLVVGASGRTGSATSAGIRGWPVHVADDVHPAHTRVLVQARAEIVEGPVAPAASPRLAELTRRPSVRYLGPSGPAYAARTFGRPRVLVRLVPTRWRTWTGREWHPRYG